MATGVCGETGASAPLRPGLEWGTDQEPVQTQSPGGEGGRAWATPCNTSLVVLDLKVRIYSSYFTLHFISKNVKEVRCTSDFVIFFLSIALQHYFLICVTVPKCEVKIAGYIFSCFCNKRKEGSRPICGHNPEWATSMRSCHGVFTDSLFLERFWREFWISFKFHKPVSKPTDLKMIFFSCLFTTFSFRFWYLILRMRP